MVKRGRLAATYIESLKEDVGQKVEDLKSAMVDGETWRRIAESTNDRPH